MWLKALKMFQRGFLFVDYFSQERVQVHTLPSFYYACLNFPWFIVRQVKSDIFLLFLSLLNEHTAYIVQIKASEILAKEGCQENTSRCGFKKT